MILNQNGDNSEKKQDDIVIVQEVVSGFSTHDIAQQAYSLQTDGGVYLIYLDEINPGLRVIKVLLRYL